ncbi:MAG: hypothetical protein R3A46_04130 [Thermomicrobiales bacterium]
MIWPSIFSFYFGTSDGGDSWHQLATGLLLVRSVTCEHFAGSRPPAVAT